MRPLVPPNFCQGDLICRIVQITLFGIVILLCIAFGIYVINKEKK